MYFPPCKYGKIIVICYERILLIKAKGSALPNQRQKHKKYLFAYQLKGTIRKVLIHPRIKGPFDQEYIYKLSFSHQ